MLWLLAGLAAGWTTAGLGQKGQDLRLVDVALLGPWLAYLATQKAPLTEVQRRLLLFTAGATIAHNGRNWMAQRNAEAQS